MDDPSQRSQPKSKPFFSGEKEMRRYGRKVLGSVIFIVIILPLSIYGWIQYRDAQALKKYGQLTTGKILLTGYWSRSHENTAFQYSVDGNLYAGGATVTINDKGLAINENGMPLREGDEFMVRYVPDDPENAEILFLQPTKRQVVKYQKIVYDQCMERYQRYPEDQQDGYCICLVKFLYKHFQLDGLANYFFQEESIVVNFSHNNRSYRKMIDSETFKTLDGDCRRENLGEDPHNN